MHSSPLIFCITLLASLIGSVAALGTIYRGDNRSPETVKASGGLTARSLTGECSEKTLRWHAEDSIGDTDPFVSCTTDLEVASFANYLYTIDPSKVPNKIWDVNAVIGSHANQREMEQAVEHVVPWAAILSVQKKEGGTYVAIPMPAKRAASVHERRPRLEKI
jgi:hypothetical protein